MATESSARDSSIASTTAGAVQQVPAGTVTRSAPVAVDESVAPATAVRTGSSPVRAARGPGRAATRGTIWVLAATMLFGAYSLIFLLVTPTFYGPDEMFQFDRVMAAEHGDVFVTPGVFRLSKGAEALQAAFIKPSEYAGSSTFGDRSPTLRSARPSYQSAGGNSRPSSMVTNYMSQHPPLYYALMGGLTWLVPGSDTMNGDALIMLIRGFNIILLLSLPLLFYRTARLLTGNGMVARAAAFLPLLVPGLARSASTINNDNLAIVLCSGILLLGVSVMRGDRTTRTAVWLAAVCLAASLTKGTAVVVLLMAPLAYLVQLIRLRRWPSRQVLAVLVLGGIASGVWWLRNLVLYGAAQPLGVAGAQKDAAMGPLRPPGVPINWGNFWHKVEILLPSRFWGALGMLEPPRLPWVTIWALTGVVVVGLLVEFVILPGRRVELIVLAVVVAALGVGVLLQAYLHFKTYLAIPGLQGRYFYPMAFALLFPIAILAVVLLARRARLAPLLVIAVSFAVAGWAVYTMVDTLWLPADVALTPGTWDDGIRQIVAFGPLAGAATVTLGVLALAVVVAGVVLVARASLSYPPRSLREELRGDERPVARPEAIAVPVPAQV